MAEDLQELRTLIAELTERVLFARTTHPSRAAPPRAEAPSSPPPRIITPAPVSAPPPPTPELPTLCGVAAEKEPESLESKIGSQVLVINSEDYDNPGPDGPVYQR